MNTLRSDSKLRAPRPSRHFLRSVDAGTQRSCRRLSDKVWLPPKLSDYENQLADRRFFEAENGSRVSINPRKVYNLAELIDIAERNNPKRGSPGSAQDKRPRRSA